MKSDFYDVEEMEVEERGMHGAEYARCYVKLQKYENLFKLSEALEKGTIFKDLYKPYK